jgi:16S rRNA C1402 N4-methylase RsmH
MILEKNYSIEAIAVDRDPNIIKIAKNNLEFYKNKVQFVLSSYSDVENILNNDKVDFILLDL